MREVISGGPQGPNLRHRRCLAALTAAGVTEQHGPLGTGASALPRPSEEFGAAPRCRPAARAGSLLAPEAALQGALREAGPKGGPACRHQDTGTCNPQDPSTALKPGRPDPSHPDLKAA